MKVITDPKVYLVGRMTLEVSECGQFFDDIGAPDWHSTALCDGDEIPEIAGRLCFDSETEILTDGGWRYFSNLLDSDRVATLNTNAKKMEFQRIKAIHEYEYSGQLLTYEGRDASFSVTPEHRQFACPSSKGNLFHEDNFKFDTTENFAKKRAFKIITAAKGWEGTIPNEIYIPTAEYQQVVSNQVKRNISVSRRQSKTLTVSTASQVWSLAKLCAHYVANGSIAKQPGAGSGIVIYGREKDEICKLASELNMAIGVYYDPRNQCPRTCVSGGLTVADYFESECGRGCQNKKLPRWVLELPEKELAEIWDILVKTDGHVTENNQEMFMTSSWTLMDQAQEILCKLGYGSYVREVESKRTCWSISKKTRSAAIIRGKNIQRTNYNGKVYCITTDNGVVLVRRNGKVHYSGNCYMSYQNPRPGGNAKYLEHIKEVGHGSVLEHTVFGFIFTGVSRSLTHELVRHRAGFGFSQVSQRYVDESIAEYVSPPDLQRQIDEGYGEWTSRWFKPNYGIDEYLILRDHHKNGTISDDAWAGIEWLFAAGVAQRAYGVLTDHIHGKALKRDCPSGDIAAWLKTVPKDQQTAYRKTARQAARSVLPNATETKIYVTANARAIRHFLEQRGSRHADAEIRKLANRILEVVREHAPNLFGDYTMTALPDGTHEITTPYPKV